MVCTINAPRYAHSFRINIPFFCFFFFFISFFFFNFQFSSALCFKPIKPCGFFSPFCMHSSEVVGVENVVVLLGSLALSLLSRYSTEMYTQCGRDVIIIMNRVSIARLLWMKMAFIRNFPLFFVTIYYSQHTNEFFTAPILHVLFLSQFFFVIIIIFDLFQNVSVF